MYMHWLLAVAGCVDAGKSTLVAVLTHGSCGRPALDSGRGSARMNVFRHKHEVESGRTSSISRASVGYDAEGQVLNYGGEPGERDMVCVGVCGWVCFTGWRVHACPTAVGFRCLCRSIM